MYTTQAMKIKWWPLLLIHGKGLILALAKMDLVHITNDDYKRCKISTSHEIEQVKVREKGLE